MTEKQKRFANEYIIDLNATKAYKVAYPHVKSDEVAAAAGARLLRNVKVKEYIEERLAEISDSKIADTKEVMEYLSSVMRGESEAEIVVVENIGDFTSEARNIKKAPDEKEKLKAAELLGRRYGMWVPERTTEIVVPIFTGEDHLED